MTALVEESVVLLEQRLRVGRKRRFVGRATELDLFRAALAGESGSFSVLFVHGPGGIGKSMLLQQMVQEADLAGRTGVQMDGRVIAASPVDFSRAGERALNVDRPVLFIDSFERCQSVERWLREGFLPQLSAGAVVVIAGRQPPSSAWLADPAWNGALGVVPLRDLSRAEAIELLSRYDIPVSVHDSLLRFAGGYPLALTLAVQMVARNSAQADGWTPDEDVIRILLSQVVGVISEPARRRALEICAHTLTTTENLLREMLPGEDAAALFHWLRSLPYIEIGAQGLYPHDVVRDALDADLRWRDPQSYEAMHVRLRKHLFDRAQQATGNAVLPAMGALNYLTGLGWKFSGVCSGRFGGDVYEDRLRPADDLTLRALAMRSEGAESAAIVEFWLRRQPAAFRTYRRSDTGEIVGFLTWLTLSEYRDDEVAADPVVAAAWMHSRATAPLRPGEPLMLARFMVDPVDYHRPSPLMDLMRLRITAEMIGNDRLGWAYVVAADMHFWRPLVDHYLLRPVDPQTWVGTRSYTLLAHDARVLPPAMFWERLDRRSSLWPVPPPRSADHGLLVLSREQFDDALRDLFRYWRRPDRLARNLLTRTRLVAGQDEGEPVVRLRHLVTQTLDALADDPRTAKLARAVVTTYVRGAPTQLAAAEQLGLPFSTYRRHLATGINRVRDQLWERELFGAPEGTAAGGEGFI